MEFLKHSSRFLIVFSMATRFQGDISRYHFNMAPDGTMQDSNLPRLRSFLGIRHAHSNSKDPGNEVWRNVPL